MRTSLLRGAVQLPSLIYVRDNHLMLPADAWAAGTDRALSDSFYSNNTLRNAPDQNCDAEDTNIPTIMRGHTGIKTRKW